MAAHIQAERLSKNYAGEHAVRDVSFSVASGVLFGLIGADGAGKSTLIKILVTLINQDSGSGRVLGIDVRTAINAIRSDIGYMPQRFSLYQDLTVRENLLFFADIFKVNRNERKDRLQRLLSFARLSHFEHRRAGKLSGGMKQKLALCCALIHTPKVLFLDEPTIGVDPVSRKEFWDILFSLKKEGVTMLVSTPYMEEAALCDELLLLHKGTVLCTGTPQELVSRYPYTLFQTASETPIPIRDMKKIRYSAVKLVYPSQGALHIACDAGYHDETTLLSEVRAVLPPVRSIRRTTPSIEDFFISMIAEKQ